MIEPMLAKEFNDRWVNGAYYLQPKLNGHRLIWDGSSLWSRQGKPILSVPGLVEQLTEYFPNRPLDGELYADGMSFKQITQIGRKTVNIQDNENLCMHVYDIPVENLSFEKRWSVLTQDYDKYFHKESRIICSQCSYFKQFPEKYTSCKNPQFLNIYRNNYEGTMLRNASGLYAFGKRSSDLLKIKQFQDAEAKIIGVTQLFTYEKVIVPMGTPGARKKSNGTYVKNGEPTPQNMIGALVCELNNGVKFEIGTGFTHEERSAYWCVPPIGHYVTFQYQELSGDGVPLFPSFLRMKEDL